MIKFNEVLSEELVINWTRLNILEISGGGVSQ